MPLPQMEYAPQSKGEAAVAPVVPNARRYGGSFGETDTYLHGLNRLANANDDKSNFINWLPLSMQQQIAANQGYVTGTDRLSKDPITIQKKFFGGARKGQGMTEYSLSGANLPNGMNDGVSAIGGSDGDNIDISHSNANSELMNRMAGDKYSFDPKYEGYMQIGSGGNQDDDIRASLKSLGLQPGDPRIANLFAYDPKYGLMMKSDFYTNMVKKHSDMQDKTRFDPVKTLAIAGMSAINPYLGAAVSTGWNGGGLKDLAINMAGAYAGGQLTKGLTPSLGQFGANAVSNSAKQFLTTGKVDPAQAALAGAFSYVPSSLQDLGLGKGLSEGLSGLGKGIVSNAIRPRPSITPRQPSRPITTPQRPIQQGNLQTLYAQYLKTKGK